MHLFSFVSICLSYNLLNCIQRISRLFVLVLVSLTNDVSSKKSLFLEKIQNLTLAFPRITPSFLHYTPI